MTPTRNRSFAWIPVVAGLVFAVACVALQCGGLPPLDVDSHRYIAGAKSLLEHGALLEAGTDGRLEPDGVRTPGYPALLAAAAWISGGLPDARGALRLVFLAQGAIWFAAGCAVALVALRGKPVRRPGLLFIGLSAMLLLPSALVGTGQVMTDLPYAALNALGCAALAGLVNNAVAASLCGGGLAASRARWSMGVVAGLCFGAATLVRPLGVIVPVLLCAGGFGWLFIRLNGPRRSRAGRIISPALLAMVCVASLAPVLWMARNHHYFGKFRQSSISGVTLLLHRQADMGRVDWRESSAADPVLARFLAEVEGTGDLYHAGLVIQREFDLSPFEVSDRLQAMALRTMAERPDLWLRQTAVNAINLLSAPADAQTALAALVGPRPPLSKPIGAALQDRDIAAIATQVLLRTVVLAMQAALPLGLLIVLLRQMDFQRLKKSRGLAAIVQGLVRRIPLVVWLLLLSSGWALGVAAASTITYGRFYLPAAPLLAALGAAAAMTPAGPSR